MSIDQDLARVLFCPCDNCRDTLKDLLYDEQDEMSPVFLEGLNVALSLPYKPLN